MRPGRFPPLAGVLPRLFRIARARACGMSLATGLHMGLHTLPLPLRAHKVTISPCLSPTKGFSGSAYSHLSCSWSVVSNVYNCSVSCYRSSAKLDAGERKGGCAPRKSRLAGWLRNTEQPWQRPGYIRAVHHAATRLHEPTRPTGFEC